MFWKWALSYLLSYWVNWMSLRLEVFLFCLLWRCKYMGFGILHTNHFDAPLIGCLELNLIGKHFRSFIDCFFFIFMDIGSHRNIVIKLNDHMFTLSDNIMQLQVHNCSLESRCINEYTLHHLNHVHVFFHLFHTFKIHLRYSFLLLPTTFTNPISEVIRRPQLKLVTELQLNPWVISLLIERSNLGDTSISATLFSKEETFHEFQVVTLLGHRKYENTNQWNEYIFDTTKVCKNWKKIVYSSSDFSSLWCQ